MAEYLEETDTMEENQSVSQTIGIDKNRKSGWRFLRRLVVIVIICVVIAGIYLKFSKTEPNAPKFTTQEAIKGNLTVTVTATGNLTPTSEVEVGSELSGIVKKLTVDYNDRVKMGQPLAYLDDIRYQAAVLATRAALASSKAKLAQAQATVTQKRQNLTRLRKADSISAGKALSPYDLESAEADYDRAKADEATARAAIQQAEANLMLDENNLAKTIIYSPVNGIVLARDIDVGQTVAASLQAPVLFTLAEDLTQMELQVDVDEADVGLVKEGQDATFTVDAYSDRTFQAKITQVRYGSETTNSVVTYKTLLKVDNPDLVLRPGMTATAEIIVEKIEDALLVPNAALRFAPPMINGPAQKRGLVNMLLPRPPRNRRPNGNGAMKTGPKVWVLENDQLRPVPVKIGPTDGTNTVVEQSPLQPGTALVTDMVEGSK